MQSFTVNEDMVRRVTRVACAHKMIVTMLFAAFLSLPSLQTGNAVKNLFRAHEFPGMPGHPQNA